MSHIAIAQKVTEWLNKMSIIKLSLELHKMCLCGFCHENRETIDDICILFRSVYMSYVGSSDTFIAK